MTASTRIVIPTKSLVKISTTSPRASIEEVANILSGASAGVGQGKGANMVASATTGNDNQTNDGGCPHAGGIVWVSSVESSDVPDIQMGAPGGVPLPAPNGFTDQVDYVVNGILPNIDARPNLDIGYGDTTFFYTQVAAVVGLGGGDLSLLVDGDIITVCGVQFTAQTGGVQGVNTFDQSALPGDADRFENKVGNHPALCGKIIANQSAFLDLPSGDWWLAFGSVTPVPSVPFSFSLQSSTLSTDVSTNGWVDGASGQIDPTYGTPLVLMYESNAKQFTAGYGFSFDSSGAPVSGLMPFSDSGDPTVTGFNGTNDVPTVTSVLRGAVADPAPTHSLQVVVTQKAVTSYYPQTAAVAPLFAAGDARSVTQALVRLIKSCLSGTDGSRNIDTIAVGTLNGASVIQQFTWTVGSR